MKKEVTIPKIPHAIFKWYCQEDKYEELHGDLEEFYYERVTELGLGKARWYYLLDVIRCCQPYAWKNSKTQTNSNIIMLSNYSKISLRNIRKNPLTSFINIFGLSMAIGICLLVYGFAQWTYSIDQFHKNKNEVYLTTIDVNRDGTLQQNGLTPRPLAKMLKEDFAQISKTCRVEDGNAVLKFESNVFHESIRYVDPEFLEMFTFPMKWGVQNSLVDINSIVLSEEMSIKYFGGVNPIGQDVLIIFDKNNSKLFKVGGVSQPFPKARDIRFDFLVNFKNIQVSDPNYDINDWSQFVKATFIQVDNPSDIHIINDGMNKYKKMQNEVQNDWAISSFSFVQFANLYVESAEINNDISYGNGDNAKSTIFLAVIAAFLLTLACFNYINIAIVSAAKRLKEIGVRKAIGATRSIVITQFLIENIVMTTFALLLGVMLGAIVFIPWFEQLNGFNMDFSLADPYLWVFLPTILLFTGVGSGIYPSLYISGFQVVKILKGTVQLGKKNPMTKFLLGFQLILACILITSAVMFTQNTTYISERNWGYDQHQVLYAKVPDLSAFDQLKAIINQNADVLSVSGSGDHLGKSVSKSVMYMPPNHRYEVNQLSVDTDYFKTMGLVLKQGRTFKKDYQSDKQSIIVNETLVRNINLEEPIGQKFEIDSTKYEIIGVVNDFHSSSFSHKIAPTIFKIADEESYQYLSLKVVSGTQQDAYLALQEQWMKLFPEVPFQGGYQEDVWGDYFSETNGAAQFWQVIAVIAIMLAALGLYGLVKLNVSGRVKEFSIRKVLGARLRHIAINVTKQYSALFLVALTIGAPASYFLMKFVFDIAYTYYRPVTFFGVVLAIIILLIVLLAVISTQLGSISKSNPVDGLKVE